MQPAGEVKQGRDADPTAHEHERRRRRRNAEAAAQRTSEVEAVVRPQAVEPARTLADGPRDDAQVRRSVGCGVVIREAERTAQIRLRVQHLVVG